MDFTRSLPELVEGNVARNQGYAYVNALIVYWGGDQEYEQEAGEIKEAFGSLGWETQRFGIPPDGNTKHLVLLIRELSKRHEGQHELLVVYYSGHGARNPKTKKWGPWS